MIQRRVVRSVNVASVARVVFALSLCFWGIAFVGLIALYLLGLVSGGLGGVEGFIASLGFTGFRLSIIPFLLAFMVAAGFASAVAAVLAGISAHLYNALFPVLGGVKIVLEDRSPEQAPAAPPRSAPRPTLQTEPVAPPAPPVRPAVPPWPRAPEASEGPAGDPNAPM